MKHLYSRLALIISIGLVMGSFLASGAWVSMGTVSTGDQMSANLWNTLVGNVDDLNSRVGSTTSSQWTTSGATISYGGNVGIGTTSPGSIFHVVGEANQIGIFERSSKQLYINANWADWNSYAQVAPRGADNMGLSLSSNDAIPEQLFIKNGGNVGIGTTSPESPLHIKRWVGSNGLALFEGNSASTWAPKIIFRDTNGGINDWTLVFDKTNGFSISGGNVGIDISNPTSNLEVNGDIGIRWTAVIGNNKLATLSTVASGGGSWYGGSLIFKTTSSTNILNEWVRINDIWNVGIGTTSPTGKLHIDNGDGSTPLFLGTLNAASNQNIVFLRQLNAGGDGGASSSLIRVENQGSNPSFISYNAGFSNPFIVTSAGSVGIGTPSPNTLLHLNSTLPYLTIDRSSGTAPSLVLFRQSGVGGGQIGIAGTTNDQVMGSVAGDMLIRSNGQNILFSTDTGLTSNVYIKNGGNVGIGTTNPQAKLDVNGNITSNGNLIYSSFLDSSPTNLLTNGNFEIGTNGWWPNLSTISQQIGGFYGAYSMKVVYSGAGDNHIVYSLPTIPQTLANRHYTFSFYAKADSAGSLTGPNFLQETSTWNGFCSIADTTLTTSWKKFQGTCTVWTTSATNWRIVLRSTGDTENHVYYDGIQVQDGTTGTEFSPFSVDNYGTAIFSKNVGIGTTTPNASLEVRRTIADANFAGWIEGTQTSNFGLGVNIANTTSSVAVADFMAGGTSRLYVRADGNIGVGTTDPQAKLDVNGSLTYNSRTLKTAGSITSDGNWYTIYGPVNGHVLLEVTADYAVSSYHSLGFWHTANTFASTFVNGNATAHGGIPIELAWVGTVYDMSLQMRSASAVPGAPLIYYRYSPINP